VRSLFIVPPVVSYTNAVVLMEFGPIKDD
jgi:hypothetical protein